MLIRKRVPEAIKLPISNEDETDWIVFRTGEFTEPHARLRPMGFGSFRSGIVCGELEGDFIHPGGDGVIDNDAVGEGVTKLHRLAIIAE